MCFFHLLASLPACLSEPHECIKQMTRFLNTLEGVRNRYKVSSAVSLRPTERSGSNLSDHAPGSPRQRSASGSFDNSCASPGRLFRRILLDPNAEREDGASVSLLGECRTVCGAEGVSVSVCED